MNDPRRALKRQTGRRAPRHARRHTPKDRRERACARRLGKRVAAPVRSRDATLGERPRDRDVSHASVVKVLPARGTAVLRENPLNAHPPMLPRRRGKVEARASTRWRTLAPVHWARREGNIRPPPREGANLSRPRRAEKSERMSSRPACRRRERFGTSRGGADVGGTGVRGAGAEPRRRWGDVGAGPAAQAPSGATPRRIPRA